MGVKNRYNVLVLIIYYILIYTTNSVYYGVDKFCCDELTGGRGARRSYRANVVGARSAAVDRAPAGSVTCDQRPVEPPPRYP